MSVYGSKDLVISLANSSDTLKDISAYVRKINGIDFDAVTEESHGFGSIWSQAISTAFTKVAPIVIEGLYDDAADTPYALWERGATRRFDVAFGGGHGVSGSVVMTKYERSPEMEKSHKYKMTLTPTGEIVDA